MLFEVYTSLHRCRAHAPLGAALRSGRHAGALHEQHVRALPRSMRTTSHALRHSRRRKSGTDIRVHEIRGLRVCQNEGCKQFFNRDHMGACNIATNFKLLVEGQAPLRRLTKSEMRLQHLSCCECASED